MTTELLRAFEHDGQQSQALTRSATCHKHGEFTAKFHTSYQFQWWSGCPKCHEDCVLADEERERQRKQALRDAQLKAWLDGANIPPRFRGKGLDDFRPRTEEQRLALDTARRYLTDFSAMLAAGTCLALIGEVGAGKTHLANGILLPLALAGRRVKYLSVMELIRELRDTWRKDSRKSETTLIRELRELDLLALDEVGVQFGTDGEKVQLFSVVDERYKAMKPTIVISNLDVQGLRDFLGDRAVDRLRENRGRVALVKGPSGRSPQTDQGDESNV